MRLILVAATVLAASAWACKFPYPADVADDDTTDDAGVDGAAAACTAGERTCSAGRYTECDASGQYKTYAVPNAAADGTMATLVMHDYECPLGCHNGEPRCLDVDATNGLNAALDTVEVSPTGLDLLINDPSGTASAVVMHDAANPSVTITLASGQTLTVPGKVISQPGGADIHVLQVRSLKIESGSRLKFIGAKPIAIVSHFDIYVAGTIDYGGPGNVGSALHPGCDTTLMSPAMGGAGSVTAGGASSTGIAGGAALPTNASLRPLEGGCHAFTALGGGGLQLVSRRRIAVAASGVIDVAGRGGAAITNGANFTMTGGGGGGNVVLEAPGVGFATGATIIGRGGSGAAGNTTTRMAAAGVAGDNNPGAGNVPGATCPDCAATGGVGGTENGAAGAGTGAGNAVSGGGGAVGRCVVRAKAFVPPPAGTMKITSSSAFIGSR